MAMIREAKRVTKPGGTIYLQGVIGYKDYLNPDPNDDAGHIAVFPYGYWEDLIENEGLILVDHPCGYSANQKTDLEIRPSWHEYKWQFIICTKED